MFFSFLFLTFSFSIFIPYSFSSFPSVNETLSEENFNELLKTNKKIIALAMSKNHQKIKIIPNAFYTASLLYGNEVDFVTLDENYSQQISINQQIQLPILLLYDNNENIATFRYPETENQFFFLMSTLFDENPISYANNLTELYSQLGNSPFSLISSKNSLNEAKSLQLKASSKMEMINLIIISQNLFNELSSNTNNDTSKLFLYRNEDQMIVDINNDINTLLLSSFPVFRTLTKLDIIESDETIICIASNRNHELYKDLLFDIGYQYEEFLVGYLGPRLYSFPEEIMGHRLPRGRNILAFNWKHNYYYDTTKIFPKSFLQEKFDLNLYKEKIHQLIEDIHSGKNKPIYASEEIPDDNDKKTVKKVVGKTYSDFINDNQHDTIILYMREDCKHCSEFESVFNNFADECYQENLTWLKFGQIDITKNSCEIDFPFIVGVPTVYVFPKDNKTNIDWLHGKLDRNSLIRFINRRGSQKLPFEEEKIDKRKAQLEMFQLISNIGKYPEKEQNMIRRYVIELGKEVGIGKNPEDIEKEMNLTQFEIEKGETDIQYDEI